MMEMSADRCGEVNSISSHIHPYYLHVLTREVGALLCRWPKTLIFYYIFVLCGRVGHWSLWVHCLYIYTVFAFSFNQFSILDWEDTYLFVYLSSVPNRYTFTCPYCNCPNFDQDGLVEHCTSLHARDARQVVGNLLRVSTSRGAYILNMLRFIPGVSHLCLDALGGP